MRVRKTFKVHSRENNFRKPFHNLYEAKRPITQWRTLQPATDTAECVPHLWSNASIPLLDDFKRSITTAVLRKEFEFARGAVDNRKLVSGNVGSAALNIGGPFKLKSVSLAWELMFTRAVFKTADMLNQHEILKEVGVLIDAGKLKTTVNDVLGQIPVENVDKAHLQIESGRLHR